MWEDDWPVRASRSAAILCSGTLDLPEGLWPRKPFQLIKGGRKTEAACALGTVPVFASVCALFLPKFLSCLDAESCPLPPRSILASGAGDDSANWLPRHPLKYCYLAGTALSRPRPKPVAAPPTHLTRRNPNLAQPAALRQPHPQPSPGIGTRTGPGTPQTSHNPAAEPAPFVEARRGEASSNSEQGGPTLHCFASSLPRPQHRTPFALPSSAPSSSKPTSASLHSCTALHCTALHCVLCIRDGRVPSSTVLVAGRRHQPRSRREIPCLRKRRASTTVLPLSATRLLFLLPAAARLTCASHTRIAYRYRLHAPRRIAFAMATSTTPPTVDAPDEPQSEGSKLRTFLGILKKYVDPRVAAPSV